MILRYYDETNGRTKLNTEIYADFRTRTVHIVNHTDDLIFRAFGIKEEPTWEDFEHFLESRCFPKTRGNCKDLLKAYGLENVGYDPLEIVKKTGGRMAEDHMYLVIEE